MKTYVTKEKDINRKWYIVDAEGQILGRLASQVAHILRGKHKAIFCPYLDTGDNVIILNVDKIAVTGKKATEKKYYRHSNYPGGLKTTTYERIMEKKPEMALTLAVKRMLPRNTLGRKMLKKLKVYTGSEHPHEAQMPEPLELKG